MGAMRSVPPLKVDLPPSREPWPTTRIGYQSDGLKLARTSCPRIFYKADTHPPFEGVDVLWGDSYDAGGCRYF